VLITHVPGSVPSPPAQLNTTEEERDDEKHKQGTPDKFAGVDLVKQRANTHGIPGIKTAIRFGRLQWLIETCSPHSRVTLVMAASTR
jgi:hypothetical protein